MKRRVNKFICTLMALMLALASFETVFASQEHQCKDPEAAAIQPHGHENQDQDHHSNQLTSQLDSKCAFCADKQCCCDGNSCACVIAHSAFAFSSIKFKSANQSNSSIIPFIQIHLVKLAHIPLLRPPIA